MNIKEIIALEEVSTDLKIAEEFYEKQNIGLGKYFKDSIVVVIAVLDLRQNPSNIEIFLDAREINK